MKRFLLITLGIFLIGIDIWLYFKAENNAGIFLLLFGLGSAIGVPIGVGLITYAFGEKQREALKKLTKLPEIQELIDKAETTEQKIAILKKQYLKLEATIQSESEHFALITRKEDLEKDAKRIIEELNLVDSELASFNGQVIEGITTNEVNKLRERVNAKRQGDLVIRLGRSQLVIERDQIMHTPFFGFWLYALLKFWQDLDSAVRKSHTGPKLK